MKVLRLHGILIQKAPDRYTLTAKPQEAITSAVAGLRSHVLQLLSLSLGGDDLAAEYVLLALMGRVFSRAEGVPQGMMSVNLTGCPASSAANGSGGWLRVL